MSVLQDPRYRPQSNQYDSYPTQPRTPQPVNFPYYHPTDTFRLNPLVLTTMKNIDCDKLQDIFGQAIQEKRFNEETQIRERTKLFNNNDDIKAIKSRIHLAELNRERAHQIHEGQVRRMGALVHDAEVDEKVLSNLEKERQLEREKEELKQKERFQAKYMIQKQMADRIHQREDSKKEYDRDKAQIDDIINKILQEDRNQREEDSRKKAIAKDYMDQAYAEKAEMKRKRKEDEQLQKEMERKYLEGVAKRENEHKAKKAAIQEEKDKIFDRLCLEKAKAQAEKDYWEDVRNQLHIEENDNRNRIKALEEKEKLQRQKEEMLQWAIDQMKLKEERKKEEQRLEEEFKIRLLKKFAMDEKEERDNLVKRKQRELELQDDIERQWRLKLEQYKLQKDQELKELEMTKMKEMETRLLIEREKERLIKENEALLKNYFAKGYYKSVSSLNPNVNVNISNAN